MAGAPDALIVERLLEPRAWRHAVGEVRLIETHISWVLLAGDYAYKIKKPLELGFLDYGTLARRRAACDEELRLNRRTAPELYLDVVAIAGPAQAPVVGGDGPVLDYAVRMRRFDQAALFGALLAEGRLDGPLIDQVARHVAEFHAAAAVAAPGGGYGDADAVRAPARQNFAQLRERLDAPELLAELAAIERWAEAEFARLRPAFDRRLAAGHVREGHGDLHLGNLVLLGAEPRLFDAIEFNPALRWIDVVADAAFLVMDLEAHGRADLANRFLDAWLARTGDYAALALLPWYQCYRAMVRAKVAAIRLEQLAGARRALALDECRGYLALAARYTRPRRAALWVASGPSGAGKTSQSQPLVEARGAIRLRSDVERKRLAGLAAEAESGSGLGAGLYTSEASRRTYARLAELARTVIAAGRPALIDATCLARGQRDAFRALARELGAPCVVLAFEAPPEVLRARVRERAARGGDASEADLAVLEAQLATREPPGPDEAADTLIIATDPAPEWKELLPRLDALTNRPRES